VVPPCDAVRRRGAVGAGVAAHQAQQVAVVLLGAGYRFLIYGDGGMRPLLEEGIAILPILELPGDRN
jgi:hypothetical protein